MLRSAVRDVDVLIIGGGQAGCFLARQLRRTCPAASVLLVEKATERSWKVGESSVDISGKYMTKRLGLGTYLYERQLPKNGLRFFFDREDKSAELHELSEIGSTGMLPFPSFQIDRARLESDLLEMNAAGGVDVRVGTRCASLELGTDGAPHLATLEGDRPDAVRARWVIDASGRSSVIAKQKGLRLPSGHACAAAWGRFRGVLDYDDWTSAHPEFRDRVSHTSRFLSTTHFCYPGYWIWFIPLRDGVISVGVVIRKEQWRDDWRKREGFLAFLRSHAPVARMIEKAELLDLVSYGQLAYDTKRFFHAPDRWLTVGEAAAFSDPLYSPGGDFIALENDYATDLVRRDLAGESASSIAERADAYERFVRMRFDATVALYQDLYSILGSYELFAAKWDFDLASYLHLWVEPYFLDLHLDLDEVKREVEGSRQVLGALRTFGAMFRAAEAKLRAEGRFFAGNTGRARLDPAIRFLNRDFGTLVSRARLGSKLRDAYQLVYDDVEALVAPERRRQRGDEPLPFARFVSGLPLLSI